VQLNNPTMQIKGVIIKDKAASTYFGFIKEFPGICAQANTPEEVSIKINVYYQKFIERLNHTPIEFEETSMF
jgi:predicted RNase H-like HicB family nuclease